MSWGLVTERKLRETDFCSQTFFLFCNDHKIQYVDPKLAGESQKARPGALHILSVP